ncbi:hypothetical protein E3N88_13585 [Mikania micrantha]|nr:hypothetical protein E3N88_13585 [Mikania micrantha]
MIVATKLNTKCVKACEQCRIYHKLDYDENRSVLRVKCSLGLQMILYSFDGVIMRISLCVRRLTPLVLVSCGLRKLFGPSAAAYIMRSGVSSFVLRLLRFLPSLAVTLPPSRGTLALGDDSPFLLQPRHTCPYRDSHLLPSRGTIALTRASSPAAAYLPLVVACVFSP